MPNSHHHQQWNSLNHQSPPIPHNFSPIQWNDILSIYSVKSTVATSVARCCWTPRSGKRLTPKGAQESKTNTHTHTVMLSIPSRTISDYIAKLSHKRISSLAKLSHINFLLHFQDNLYCLLTSVRSFIL